jgi:hypothetical protein
MLREEEGDKGRVGEGREAEVAEHLGEREEDVAEIHENEDDRSGKQTHMRESQDKLVYTRSNVK